MIPFLVVFLARSLLVDGVATGGVPISTKAVSPAAPCVRPSALVGSSDADELNKTSDFMVTPRRFALSDQ